VRFSPCCKARITALRFFVQLNSELSDNKFQWTNFTASELHFRYDFLDSLFSQMVSNVFEHNSLLIKYPTVTLNNVTWSGITHKREIVAHLTFKNAQPRINQKTVQNESPNKQLQKP
jgi:hypothetical protein